MASRTPHALASPTSLPETGSATSHSATRLGLGEGLALATVLLAAAALRLGWPGTNDFSFDQARVSWMALRMVRDGQFASVGMQSSTAAPNLPGAIWIFCLPYLFTSDPLVATLFVGVLNVLAVLCMWWLVRRTWGCLAALSTTALFATSPYAVLYARSIWSQDLLAPLGVLWAAAGIVGISARKGWAIALHVFLAGFAFQVHYSGIVLIPATLLLALRYRLWRQWPMVLLGGGIAVACALPFGLHLLRSTETRTALLGVLGQASLTDGDAWRQLGILAIGHDWEWLLLGEEWEWPALWGAAKSAAVWGVAALALGGLGLSLAGTLRGIREVGTARVDVGAACVVIWAVCGPLAFLRHGTPVHRQYLLAVLPAAFLAVGALIGALRGRALAMGVTALCLVLSVAQAWPVGLGLQAVANEETLGSVGTPLRYQREAAQALKDGSPVVVHAYGDTPEYLGDVAGFDVLLWDYPHRLVDGRSVLLIPAGSEETPARLFATFTDLPAWQEALISVESEDVSLLPRRAAEPPYATMYATGVKDESFQIITPARLANGATLLGWRMGQLGETQRFCTLWRIDGPVPDVRYHQFNHLVDAAGNVVANQDAPLSSQVWQAGDTLIAFVDVKLPEGRGEYHMSVGMYSYPDVQRVAVLDREGDPLAPISLGPLTASGD
ncbi:MAG: ArnT family glycosyltransferase [Anaerolineae bacterium]